MRLLRRRWGILVACAFALVLLGVPLQRVAACSCAMTTLPEAVRDADAAFVGRLVEHEPGGDNFGFPVLDAWHWSVERSRDADAPAIVTVLASVDDGANCGVSFAPGQRWLVLAHRSEGELHTNGCLPNRPMDAADPEVETLVAGFAPVTGAGSTAGGFEVPLPILAIGAALGAAILVGLIAFRRAALS